MRTASSWSTNPDGKKAINESYEDLIRDLNGDPDWMVFQPLIKDKHKIIDITEYFKYTHDRHLPFWVNFGFVTYSLPSKLKVSFYASSIPGLGLRRVGGQALEVRLTRPTAPLRTVRATLIAHSSPVVLSPL